MPYFKDIRDSLLTSYWLNHIDLTEYVILNDLYKSANPDMMQSSYQQFDLEQYTDDECKVNFRLYKHEVYRLKEALQLPEEFLCYNNVAIDSIEALCIIFIYIS